KLAYIIKKKQEIYQLYQKYLNGKVKFLKLNNDFSHIPFRVVIFVDNAQETIDFMLKRGIEGRSVFYPLNKQPCYNKTSISNADYKNSEKCYIKGICLPTWVGLSSKEIQYVSESLLKVN
ncbi:uncharacterized protein METZ01_LOCUS455697, partial [marine metagenome]